MESRDHIWTTSTCPTDQRELGDRVEADLSSEHRNVSRQLLGLLDMHNVWPFRRVPQVLSDSPVVSLSIAVLSVCLPECLLIHPALKINVVWRFVTPKWVEEVYTVKRPFVSCRSQPYLRTYLQRCDAVKLLDHDYNKRYSSQDVRGMHR